jgi:hypothetical protein
MAASPTASCSSPSLPSGDPDLRHGAAAAQGPHLGCLDELATVGYACSFVVFTDTAGYALVNGTKELRDADRSPRRGG